MPYQRCLECGAVYETKQDLVNAHNETIESFKTGGSLDAKIRPVTLEDNITFCGECLHDFPFPPDE